MPNTAAKSLVGDIVGAQRVGFGDRKSLAPQRRDDAELAIDRMRRGQQLAGGGTTEDAAQRVDERETSYPKGDMFGVLPAYGFYCRHVRGLRMENIELTTATKDERPSVIKEDVE